MHDLSFDIAHTLAGSLVLVSFMMIYQDRLYALLNAFAMQAFLLAAAVAWQAYIRDAHHLYASAGIALVFKAIIVPWALHKMIRRLGIHREVETSSASCRPCWRAWGSWRCRSCSCCS